MKKTIADSVSEKIKRGDVTMRNQFSLWGERIGIDGGVFALLISLILIAGFIFFWITSNNDLLVGEYGKYGLSSFVQSFPYIFLLGFISLFILLILILRKFDFSYKTPFLYILLLVVFGIISLGWLTNKHPMGQGLYQKEGRVLRMGMMNNRNAVTGTVTEINDNKVVIQNDSNEEILIKIDSNTHYPFGTPMVGDEVRAVGTWDDTQFSAVGVRVFDETNPSTLMPGMMRGSGQGRGQGRGINRGISR